MAVLYPRKILRYFDTFLLQCASNQHDRREIAICNRYCDGRALVVGREGKGPSLDSAPTTPAFVINPKSGNAEDATE